MPCTAIKTTGEVCNRPAVRLEEDIHPAHLELCRQHITQYARHYHAAGNVHHQEGRCRHFMTTHRWCTGNPAPGGTVCPRHRATVNRRLRAVELRLQRQLLITDLTMHLVDRAPAITWQDAIREVMQRHDLSRDIRYNAALNYYRSPQAAALDHERWRLARPVWRFVAYWDWLLVGGVGPEPQINEIPPPPPFVNAPPPPPRARGLADIARDSQNVHTTAVVHQTNEMERKLMSISVPKEQQTEPTIMAAWMALPKQLRWGDTLRAIVDVHKWFTTRSCRRENDDLYKRILRGAVTKINQSPPDIRQELFGRLREECLESVGMCCEGHISRLCNVFVGFDDAFKPQLSLGEVMQNVMAAIAAADKPTETRLAEARAWFDEHGVPEDDRRGWLMAIEAM